MEADMPRKLYDQQYKLEAVQLAKAQGVNKTAANLGINPNMLGRWKRELKAAENQGKPVFMGPGKQALTEAEQEIQRLRKELEIARQERDILKKAVTFFAKESK
jgi:transposase